MLMPITTTNRLSLVGQSGNSVAKSGQIASSHTVSNMLEPSYRSDWVRAETASIQRPQSTLSTGRRRKSFFRHRVGAVFQSTPPTGAATIGQGSSKQVSIADRK